MSIIVKILWNLLCRYNNIYTSLHKYLKEKKNTHKPIIGGRKKKNFRHCSYSAVAHETKITVVTMILYSICIVWHSTNGQNRGTHQNCTVNEQCFNTECRVPKHCSGYSQNASFGIPQTEKIKGLTKIAL